MIELIKALKKHPGVSLQRFVLKIVLQTHTHTHTQMHIQACRSLGLPVVTNEASPEGARARDTVVHWFTGLDKDENKTISLEVSRAFVLLDSCCAYAHSRCLRFPSL